MSSPATVTTRVDRRSMRSTRTNFPSTSRTLPTATPPSNKRTNPLITSLKNPCNPIPTPTSKAAEPAQRAVKSTPNTDNATMAAKAQTTEVTDADNELLALVHGRQPLRPDGLFEPPPNQCAPTQSPSWPPPIQGQSTVKVVWCPRVTGGVEGFNRSWQNDGAKMLQRGLNLTGELDFLGQEVAFLLD